MYQHQPHLIPIPLPESTTINVYCSTVESLFVFMCILMGVCFLFLTLSIRYLIFSLLFSTAAAGAVVVVVAILRAFSIPYYICHFNPLERGALLTAPLTFVSVVFKWIMFVFIFTCVPLTSQTLLHNAQ